MERKDQVNCQTQQVRKPWWLMAILVLPQQPTIHRTCCFSQLHALTSGDGFKVSSLGIPYKYHQCANMNTPYELYENQEQS